MHNIPLRTKKIMIWIPVINCFCVFAWMYSSTFDRNPKRNFAKVLWIFFSSSLPLAILQQLIGNAFPNIEYILFNLNCYIIPLIMGFRFIKYFE